MNEEASISLGVLVSGGGTNLQAIIDKIHFGPCDANISCVISNTENAYALTRASKASIHHTVIPHTHFATKDNFETELIRELDKHHVDIVILAGFMRVLGNVFVSRYLGRSLNIHPSLLPELSGLHTHQRALDQGLSKHGCSVHFVTTELDGGPVILQASVPVFDNDDANTLAKRVLEKEHIIYPKCVEWLCTKKIALTDGLAYYENRPLNKPLQLDEIANS